MKHALTLLVLVCQQCLAAPMPDQNIANMVAQNEDVMKYGVCAVANAKNTAKGAKEAILLPDGLHIVPSAEVEPIRGAGYGKNKKTGRFTMSEAIEKACKKDRDSGGCIYARSRWSQLPLSQHRP
jgi:hypothetical protein